MEQLSVGGLPRSLKEKQRQEREVLILQAAEEMLIEKGYYETSIDEIASRVGIAKGTVYLHFPSKEDLVIAIFLREIRQFMSKVDEVVGMEISARHKITAILHYMYGEMFAKRMQFIYSLQNSGYAFHQKKEQDERLRGSWEYVAARISEVLEQGKVAGEFVLDVPTPVMLSVFFSLMSPRSCERLITEEKMAGDELAIYLGRIYFNGITLSKGESI